MNFLPAISSDILEDAIVKTVAFFDVLDYPLTIMEIHDRLLGFEANVDEIQSVLEKSKRVSFINGYVVLPERDRIIEMRLRNVSADLDLWKRVKRYEWMFRIVPFVQGVYVCNRLALTQGSRESDIDVFVIAEEGRMFIVRTFLLFLSQIFGVRRHGDRVARRFCLSFFVDTSLVNLQPLSDGASDIYFSYWVLLLRPIFSAFDIRTYNSWLSGYFSEDLLRRNSQPPPLSPSYLRRFFTWIFVGRFGDTIESLFRTWQLRRSRQKFLAMGSPHGVVLHEHCLKFHDHDMRSHYFQEWRKRVEKY